MEKAHIHNETRLRIFWGSHRGGETDTDSSPFVRTYDFGVEAGEMMVDWVLGCVVGSLPLLFENGAKLDIIFIIAFGENI